MNHSTGDRGFTVLELLVIIGIIGVLATVLLVNLHNATTKAKDKTVLAQLTSMRTQAPLYNGAAGSPVAATFSNTKLSIGSNLFDGATTNNSLITLINGLPAGTSYYYAWDGVLPSLGGKWFVAAALTTGGACVDYAGLSRTVSGATPLNAGGFTALYTNTGSYSCK